MKTGPTVELRFEGHQSHVLGAAFTPDRALGAHLAAPQNPRLWDAATGQLTRTFEGHNEQVISAAIYPEGKRFLSASVNGSVGLWDVQSPKPVLQVRANLGRLRCVALSPDGRLALAAGHGSEHRIIVWNAASGLLAGALQGHTAGVLAAVFSRAAGKSIPPRWIRPCAFGTSRNWPRRKSSTTTRRCEVRRCRAMATGC